MLLKILDQDNFICNFYFLCLVDRHQSLHTDVLFISCFFFFAHPPRSSCGRAEV